MKIQSHISLTLQRCTECDKVLKPGDEVWLEKRISDNTYHANLGEVIESDSQGAFAFGKTCAKKVLKNKGVSLIKE